MKPTPGPGHPDFLGRGGHRTVFLRHRVVLKRLNFHYPFNVNWNPNRAEWENYRRYFNTIPPRLQNSFMHVKRMTVNRHGLQLVVERITNHDGSRARALSDYASLPNAFFWKRMQEMVDWMAKKKIGFYDWSPANFLVRWVSDEKCVPVLIDYEDMGAHHRRFQPWLRIPFFSKRKMQRRMDRMRKPFVTAQSPGMRE